MTAPRMTLRQEGRARLLAREIGAAFRAERLARRDRVRDIGQYLGLRGDNGNVARFERHATPNMTLSIAVRYLAIYGLTLAVVPVERAQ